MISRKTYFLRMFSFSVKVKQLYLKLEKSSNNVHISDMLKTDQSSKVVYIHIHSGRKQMIHYCNH